MVLAHPYVFGHDGRIVGLRYFRDLADGFDHVGILRDGITGVILRVVRFPLVAAAGSGPGSWQHAYLSPRLNVLAGETVLVSVTFGGSLFYYDASALAGGPIVSGDLTIPQDSPPGTSSFFDYQPLNVPSGTYLSTHYGVDCLYQRKP